MSFMFSVCRLQWILLPIYDACFSSCFDWHKFKNVGLFTILRPSYKELLVSKCVPFSILKCFNLLPICIMCGHYIESESIYTYLPRYEIVNEVPIWASIESFCSWLIVIIVLCLKMLPNEVLTFNLLKQKLNLILLILVSLVCRGSIQDLIISINHLFIKKIIIKKG